MEHKRECYINICGSIGNINGNNLGIILCFEDMFGYHGNWVTARKYFGLSSNRTL